MVKLTANLICDDASGSIIVGTHDSATCDINIAHLLMDFQQCCRVLLVMLQSTAQQL